jgi:tyrosyl-tRNA synthetase
MLQRLIASDSENFRYLHSWEAINPALRHDLESKDGSDPRISLADIQEFEEALAQGTNPKDIKLKLAFEITKMYHGETEADKAEQYFINTFTKKEIPDDIQEFLPSDFNIVNILVESKLSESKSEARRTIEQGGVKVNSEVVKNLDMIVDKGSVIQKGKMGFVKVI